VTQADFAAFVLAHGEYESASKESFRTGLAVQRFVFEDGALVQAGIFFDPPKDRWQLLTLKREYLSLALAREEKAWHEYRAEVMQQAAFAAKYKNLPPPPVGAEAWLAAGKERILELRQRLADLDAELAEEPGTKRKRTAERVQADLEAERQAATAGRLQKFRTMNI
jgi:hypothetical protein